MNKQQEALRLALEALEYISSHYMSLPKIGCMALAAVEEALAEQPAQQHIEHCLWARNGNQPCPHVQPAQQQEPLFWYDEEEGWLHYNYDDAPSGCIPLYTSPPASKPWVGLTDEDLQCFDADAVNTARYWEAKLRELNEHREKNA